MEKYTLNLGYTSAVKLLSWPSTGGIARTGGGQNA